MIHSSRNPEVSGKLDAECVRKREANAQRTQAYHSRRESLMTNSSRDLEVSGKADAVFSCHSEFEMLDAKIAFSVKKHHFELLLQQEKSQSGRATVSIG